MKNQIKKLKSQINNLNKQFVLFRQSCYNTNTKNNFKKELMMQNPKQIDILDVAQYIINHQNKDDYTKMKVQKLVFFVYCKYLVDYKEKFFPNDFEAWEYGPVSPKLYLQTLPYTCGIEKGTQIKEKFDENCFNNEQKKIINHVLKRYGTRTASFLVKLTHKEESPWCRCFISKDWNLNAILDETIIKYYSKKNNKI